MPFPHAGAGTGYDVNLEVWVAAIPKYSIFLKPQGKELKISDDLANLSLTCVRNKAVDAKPNSVGVPAT